MRVFGRHCHVVERFRVERRYDNNHNFQVYGHQKFKTGTIRSYVTLYSFRQICNPERLSRPIGAKSSVRMVSERNPPCSALA